MRSISRRLPASLWVVVLALATTGGYVREPLTGQMLLNVLIAVSIPVAVTWWFFVGRNEDSARLKCLWFLGVWCAVAVAGLAWTPDTGMGIRYVFYMIVRLALIIITAHLIVRQKNGGLTTAIAFLAVAVVAVNVGLAAWEYITHSHLPLSASIDKPPHLQGLPSAFLTNPNDLCFLLILYLPFITAWPRRQRRAATEALAIAALVVVIWVATAAQSRALIALLLLQLLWLSTAGMRHKLMAMAGAMVVAGLLIPFFQHQWPRYVVEPDSSGTVKPERASTLDQSQIPEAIPAQSVDDPSPRVRPAQSVDDPSPRVRPAQSVEEALRAVVTEFSFGGRSGSERLVLLRIGGALFMDSRGLGVGPGASSSLVRQKKPEGRTNLHNWWMELLVDYGVAGFLAFVIFHIWLWLSVFRRWRALPDGHERYLAEVALVSLTSFTLGSIVPSSIAPHPYPWMLFGLALALVSAPGSPAFQSYRRQRETPP